MTNTMAEFDHSPTGSQSYHMTEYEKGSAVHHNEIAGYDNDLTRTDTAVTADEEWKFTPKIAMAFVALLLGYMSAVFCIQMASVALSSINADIGPSTSYAWMATAQILPVAVFGPLVGRLSDVFGRRPFIMLGNLCGLIGCCIAATATDVNTVIGGSIFIGCATSMQQLAWSSLGEIVPMKYRGLVLGLFELANIAPGAFGPIIGEAVVLHAGWRWCYWFPFILDTLGLFMIFVFYRPKNQYIREEGKTLGQEILDVDWIGCALWGAGLTLILCGISFGGGVLAWNSAGVISMIVIGAVLIIALGFYEAYTPMVLPLFPGEVLGNYKGVTLVLAGTALFGMLYYSTAILWALQIQALYTTDKLSVGWYASALGMAGIPCSTVTGLIWKRWGARHSRLLFALIIGCGTVGAGLMALVSAQSRIYSTVFVAMIGLCTGGGFVVAAAIIQMSVTHENLGVATALCVTARNIGGSVATTIYTTIFSDRLKAFIVPDLATPLAKAGVPLASLEGVILAFLGEAPPSALAKLTPAQIEIGLAGVKNTYAHAFRIVYLSSIAFGVIGTICVCFVNNVGDQLTDQVDIHLAQGAIAGAVTDTGKGHIISIEDQEKLRHRHGHKS